MTQGWPGGQITVPVAVTVDVPGAAAVQIAWVPRTSSSFCTPWTSTTPSGAAIGHRVGVHRLAVALDRRDVERGVVVREDGLVHVARRPGSLQVARSGEDRVTVAVHVAPGSVRGPGRGNELHRSLRARSRITADAAHAGLDEVDRCEEVPRHPKGRLGLLVVAHQLRDGRRL